MSDTTTDALAISGTPATFYPVGTPVNFVPTVTGAAGTLTFSLTGSPLPAGLALDPSTGAVTGTPSTAGSVATIIKVSDGTSSKLLPVVFNVVAKVSLVGTLPSGIVGKLFNATLTPTGGSGTLTLKSVGAETPSWLTVTATTAGVNFEGTPTYAGSTTFGITLTDDYGDSFISITLSTYLALDVSFTPDTTTVAVNSAVSLTPTVAGGTGDYAYTASNLPTGITIDGHTGLLSGTVSEVGSYAIVVTVVSGDQTATATATVVGVQPVTLSYPPLNAVQNVSVSLSPVVSGGSGAPTFTVASTTQNPLPDGLSLDPSTGVISGKPTLSSTGTFSITVTDAVGSATASVNTLIETPITITGSLSPMLVGTTFAFTPIVTGGVAENYTFSYSSLSPLPAGVSFNSVTGAVTGSCSTLIPEQEIVISVTDGIQTARLTVALRVLSPAAFESKQTTTFAIGVAGSYVVQGSGFGNTPVYAIVTGSLPAGLYFSPSTAVISGTPVEVGTTELTIRGIGPVNSDTTTVTITVVGSIGISGVPAQGTVGMAYSFVPTVTGGASTRSFSLTTTRSNNSLPDGLVFNTATGSITGTPTSADSVLATIQVTDGFTTATLSNVAVAIMSVQNSNAPGASDIYVQQRIAAYVSLLSKPRVTTAIYESAMRVMADITNTIIKHPTSVSFGYLYDAHVKYKATFFDELNFFIGCEVLGSTDMTKVSTVYSAYRELTMTPKNTYNFRNIGLYPVSCSALMVWMENKRKILIATP